MPFIYTDRTRTAFNLAYTAHHGQKDKTGYPYILHLMAVADKAQNEDECIVAILHDLCEDIDPRYIVEIRNLFGNEIADAVDAITRKAGEKYKEYIERCCKNKLARVVKLYDLMHNMNKERASLNPTLESLQKRQDWAFEYVTQHPEG